MFTLTRLPIRNENKQRAPRGDPPEERRGQALNARTVQKGEADMRQLGGFTTGLLICVYLSLEERKDTRLSLSPPRYCHACDIRKKIIFRLFIIIIVCSSLRSLSICNFEECNDKPFSLSYISLLHGLWYSAKIIFRLFLLSSFVLLSATCLFVTLKSAMMSHFLYLNLSVPLLVITGKDHI